MRHPLISILVALIAMGVTSCNLFPPEEAPLVPEEQGLDTEIESGSRSLQGEFDAFELNWLVNHFSEAVCTGGASLIAGADFQLEGRASRLGEVVALGSVAWDWSLPASGLHTPTGNRALNGASATVLSAYPHDFSVDPFSTFSPFAPTCGSTASATGTFTLTDADGDHVTGIITGGEIYELSFGSFPGDGQEQFLEVAITGGTGELYGSRGSFVVHSIFNFTGPGLVTSEIMKGGEIEFLNCKRMSGGFADFAFSWMVSHFSEQICSGGASLVAGSRFRLSADVDPLEKGTVELSVAWDWALPAQGLYAPGGPRLGNSASATVLSSYPYAFAVDPFSTNNPLDPRCGSTVSATGEFVLQERDGDRLIGVITGGEVYELAFDFPGDGLEQFMEVSITGGKDGFSDANGSFVIHNVFRFSPLGPGLVSSEILRGGAICKD